MKDGFLLKSDYAQMLYKSVKDLPIIDYHCHLSPKEIYQDIPFKNLGEMWLSGDHYKWRLMRNFGIDEKYITGDASYYEKFKSYAKAVATAARNPLYNWSHMELDMYFGIDLPLNEENADYIWESANAVIAAKQLSPRKLIEQSKVEYLATTDDVCDTLEWHEKIKTDKDFGAVVAPSFRTDNLLLIKRENYTEYINKLSKISGLEVTDFDSFKAAIINRLDYFHKHGCLFSDIGIEYFPSSIASESEVGEIFKKAITSGSSSVSFSEASIITDAEFSGFLGYMFVFLGAEYAKRNMVMQWHLAVKRNANSKAFHSIGADSGFDCVGDGILGENIIRILDAINTKYSLPKTIMYSLNPSMATQLNVIAGSYKGVRTGAAWWFLDHYRGISEQLNIVAETGHIGTFLGMLTDSRSFLSYARHDYFRRILCSLVGEWVESGELYNNSYSEKLVKDISYYNIKNLIGGIL